MRFLYILPIAIFSLTIISCGNKNEVNHNTDANKLYTGTCDLTKTYIDSMEQAKDSMALHGLMERYDNKITELNFSVTADTDFDLTEGKNDTIALLVDSIRRVFDRKLNYFAHHKLSNDSINKDSVIIDREILPSDN